MSELDPRTNRVVRRFRIADPGAYPNMVYAFGALWLQGGSKPQFTRIDPATGKATTYRIPNWEQETDAEGGDITAGMGSLWMQTSPAVIGRFDPKTGKRIARYPADGESSGSWPLPAYGSLWVANFDTNTVWRDRVT